MSQEREESAKRMHLVDASRLVTYITRAIQISSKALEAVLKLWIGGLKGKKRKVGFECAARSARITLPSARNVSFASRDDRGGVYAYEKLCRGPRLAGHFNLKSAPCLLAPRTADSRSRQSQRQSKGSNLDDICISSARDRGLGAKSTCVCGVCKRVASRSKSA